MDQFIRHCNTLASIQGGYLWADMQHDPDCIAAMAAVLDDKPSRPPLFGWTAIIDKLTNIGDQLIASRASNSKVDFYPRPIIPVRAYKRNREISDIDADILSSQKRYAERNSAVQNLGVDA